MATGASGIIIFQGTRGLTNVLDDIYLRVYWKQEYERGGTSSTLTIEKVTVQSKSYNYGGNFFYDGIITIAGETVLSASMQEAEVVTISKDTETQLPFASVSKTINQSGGSATSVEIGVNKRPGTNYNYFTFYNPTYTNYNSYVRGTQSAPLNTIPQPRTVTLSPGTGSYIRVNGSTTSPQTFYDGDIIVIEGGANTGYNFGSLTVNGSSFTSGSTYSVTSAVTVNSTASVKSYTLSISAGTGSSITVNRTSSPYAGGSTGNLSNGATIYYGDALYITFGASTGFSLSTHTVNGSSFTSGSTYSVTSAVTVNSTASVKSYTLSISAGTGSSIAVNRTSSPYAGGSTGILSSGTTIYYGDALYIIFGASTGFNLSTHTVNGSSFTSGGTHTVSSAVTVNSTATAKSYTLSISAGTGSSITVNRTSSPYADGSTSNLSNGATIYYGDVLKITFTINSGYEAETTTVNGETFTSGNSHTVVSNVTVVSTAVLGVHRYQMYIDDGSMWCPVLPYIDVNSI